MQAGSVACRVVSDRLLIGPHVVNILAMISRKKAV